MMMMMIHIRPTDEVVLCSQSKQTQEVIIAAMEIYLYTHKRFRSANASLLSLNHHIIISYSKLENKNELESMFDY